MVEGSSRDIWISLGMGNRIDSMDGLGVGVGQEQDDRVGGKGDAGLRDKIWGEKQLELRNIRGALWQSECSFQIMGEMEFQVAISCHQSFQYWDQVTSN